MKKYIVLILLLAFCSSGSESSNGGATLSVAATSINDFVYEDTNGTLVNIDLTNKKTLVVFWADY